MTVPADETLEREKNKLWVIDAELIRRLGVPEKIARAAIRMLDAKVSDFSEATKIVGRPALLAGRRRLLRLSLRLQGKTTQPQAVTRSFTLTEASAELRVSKRWLRNWLYDGRDGDTFLRSDGTIQS